MLPQQVRHRNTLLIHFINEIQPFHFQGYNQKIKGGDSNQNLGAYVHSGGIRQHKPKAETTVY